MKKIIPIVCITIIANTTLNAGYYESRTYNPPVQITKENSYSTRNTISIPVISSEKIMDEMTIRKKVQNCWNEKITVKVEQEADVGTQLFGALLGGAIGSQFGKGTGKIVGGATGAVVGTAIAREHGGQGETMYEDKIIKKCKTEYIPKTELVFSHYSNTAEFLGKKITKNTQEPLKEIVISFSY